MTVYVKYPGSPLCSTSRYCAAQGAGEPGNEVKLVTVVTCTYYILIIFALQISREDVEEMKMASIDCVVIRNDSEECSSKTYDHTFHLFGTQQPMFRKIYFNQGCLHDDKPSKFDSDTIHCVCMHMGGGGGGGGGGVEC